MSHLFSSPLQSDLQARIVQTTRDLILIKSTSSLPQERKRCFQLLQNHLDAIPDLELKMFESNGFESLVAKPKSVAYPEILFLAHLDVVEHSGTDFYRSTTKDGRIYGPGAGDMKGALAILMVLFNELLSESPELPIALAVTSDEEQGGENGARFLLEECDLKAEYVILPDGGSLNEITVEEKGILHARAIVKGRSAHASRPWRGDNALLKFMRNFQNLRNHFAELQDLDESQWKRSPGDDYWFPTCSITGINTFNHSINCIPDLTHVTFDVRFPPPHTAESMLDFIKKSLGPEVEVQSIVSAEPTQLEPDPLFLDATKAITGSIPSLKRMAGGSDARFFHEHGIPVILSRPLVGNIHGPDEWIDIDSMMDYYRICDYYVRMRCSAEDTENLKDTAGI